MMKPRNDGASNEELVRLLEVFSGGEDLMNWLTSLQGMSDNTRTSHLRSMVEGMRANDVRPELIAVVKSLMSPDVFEATTRALQTLNG